MRKNTIGQRRVGGFRLLSNRGLLLLLRFDGCMERGDIYRADGSTGSELLSLCVYALIGWHLEKMRGDAIFGSGEMMKRRKGSCYGDGRLLLRRECS